MNLRGCKCLNIIIETEIFSIPFAVKDQLELTTEEGEDIFFQEENLLLVERLDNTHKSVPGLVETREVGSWVIHYCINCKIHTHAVHKEKGASYIVASSNLLTSDAIRKLKNSEHYSRIYAIMIDTSQCDEENDETFYPDGLEPVVKDLKQTLTESMRKEAALVEEKIRTFTEEQYNMLDNLRDKLYNEERVLIRNLASHFSMNPKEETNVQKINTLDPERQIESTENIDSKSSQSTPILRHAPKRQKSTPEQNNYDFLFEFEGIDDNSLQREDDGDSDDVDDTQNKSRDQYQPRRRNTNTNYAKSLPMDIPVFMRGKSNEDAEYEDDILQLEEETDVDIADSIKKIARSVHGGGIFGDLPRPRFSTQL